MGKAKRIVQQKKAAELEALEKKNNKDKREDSIEREEFKQLKKVYMARQAGREAKVSPILGILSVIGCLIPVAGIALGMMGFALGWRGRKSDGRRKAYVGMIISVVGIIVALFMSMLSDYIRHFVPLLPPTIQF